MTHTIYYSLGRRNGQRSLFALLVWLLAGVGAAFAQNGFFVPLTSAQARLAAPDLAAIEKYGLYELKTTALRSYLAQAPLENRPKALPLQLAIPLPDGTTEPFGLAESPVLSPALAAQHPEIKTYTGRGTVHQAYTIRLSLTSSGFDAIILGVDNGTVYVTKVTNDSLDQRYATYFARDVKKNDPANPTSLSGKCGTTTPAVDIAPEKSGANARTGAALNNTGATLRTFRLAISATKEFVAAKGGGTVDGAFNAIVGYVNRMNAVYRRELSVAFTLVSGKNTIFTSGNDGGFNNADLGTMLDRNQGVLDNAVGNDNYDIGHVIGNSGGSGEGLAQSSSACKPGEKAKGATSFGDGSFAAIFDDQTLSHEVGHQFGMSHTFNSSIPVCTTREAATSVEPGAGTTIMSYGYTCSDQNNAARNDDYETPRYQPILNFHTVSYQQANTYIATLSCFTSTPLNNAVPVIGNFPASVTIPKSTPFALSATATDADAGDKLTYSWEGTNIGQEVPGDATLADTAKPPFFRSYEPAATGTRTYPRLEAILNGSNYAKGDKLPSVGIATTHVLTVRDNAGGLTYQGLTVTVDGNSGPFLETTNLSGSYAGNSVQTITWSVANTNAAPVNSPNVDILLSTDGGLTFPTVLKANTPNDGSEAVALPAVLTSTARIKVASSNNIFFDISNKNFSITAPSGVPVVNLTAPDSVATEGAKGPDNGGRRAAANSNGRFAAEEEDVTDYAYFHFERTSGNGKMTVRFEISGSAAGDSRISIADTVSFEDGELSFDLYIIPGDDDIEEGDEDLILTLIDEDDYDVLESSNTAKVIIKDNDSNAAAFAIAGVTTVSCIPSAGNPNKRELTFTPRYQGTNGQPITFSVRNETLPTTAPGPYTLGIYLDNPTITLKATQSGTPGEASFSYNWLAVCGTPPPPTGAFAITGVTTVSCIPSAGNPNKRELTFTPRYQGTNGQPITFSVRNETLPTTAPGPYTLGIYLDNPTITLKATQSGTPGEASFSYNWLAVCGTGNLQSKMPRESVAEVSLEIRVLGNPVVNGRVQVEVSGTGGQPMEAMLTDLRGRVMDTQRVERPAPIETLTYDVGRQPLGMLLLRVSTTTQMKAVKLLKAE